MKPGRMGLALTSVLLLCCGCTGPKVVYGDRSGQSIDGLGVVTGLLAERFATGGAFSVNERIDDYDTIIHFQTRTPIVEALTAVDEETADQEAEGAPVFDHDQDVVALGINAEQRLREWLAAEEGRQLVICLRNGRFSPWLLERWIEELQARIESGNAEPERLDHASEQIRLYRDLIDDEAHGPDLEDEERIDCFDVAIERREPAAVAEMAGPWARSAAGVPSGLQRTVAIVPDATARVLWRADDAVLAVERPLGRGRLVLVATSVPFLDGALVDASARALLGAFLEELEVGGAEDVLVVDAIEYHDFGQPEPNIIGTLFMTKPFAPMAWHLLALLLLYAWWRAAWMGRTAVDRQLHLRTFGGHVDALAGQLRGAGRFEAVLRNLARVLGQPEPRARSLDAAVRAARGFTGGGRSGAPLADRSDADPDSDSTPDSAAADPRDPEDRP